MLMRSDFNLDLWLRGPSALLRLRLRLAQDFASGLPLRSRPLSGSSYSTLMRSDFNLDLWLRGPSTLLRLRLRLAQDFASGLPLRSRPLSGSSYSTLMRSDFKNFRSEALILNCASDSLRRALAATGSAVASSLSPSASRLLKPMVASSTRNTSYPCALILAITSPICSDSERLSLMASPSSFMRCLSRSSNCVSPARRPGSRLARRRPRRDLQGVGPNFSSARCSALFIWMQRPWCEFRGGTPLLWISEVGQTR